MFNKSALTAALILGVATTASANSQLGEWDGFAAATETQVAAYDHNIDWNNLGGNDALDQLIEWKNFAAATETQVAAYDHNIDWNNLGGNDASDQLVEWNGFGKKTVTLKQVASSVDYTPASYVQSTYPLPEFNGFGDANVYEAPTMNAYNEIDWGNLYQS